METKKRDTFGDVLKGIGIIMIVMGHSWQPTVPYVYTSHLALFFFIMGLHFSEKKYFKNPTLLLSTRLASLWPQYVFYTSLFIVLHNLFIELGIYSTSIPKYKIGGIIQNILYSFVFYSSEQMGGSLWFVPMFLIGTAFMGLAFYLGNKYFSSNITSKYIFILFIFIFLGILGLLAINKGMNLPFNYQTALLLLPVAYVGFIFSLYKKTVQRYITWYGALIMIVMLWFVVGIKGIRIDGPANQIINLILYYPVTFAGIYVSLWIGKKMDSIKIASVCLSTIGKYSFEIMALHFFTFKIVDLIYAKLNNRPFHELSGFPTSYSQLGPIYVIVGVILPILLLLGWNQIKPKLKLLAPTQFKLSKPTFKK